MKESEFELETILELKDKTVRNYLNYHKDISKEEEKKTLRELFKLKKEGNKEEYINKRNELSRNYLKYLILKSKKSYLKGYGKVPLEDYISESYLGLLKAFEKFDVSKYDN
jgi:DNA-directed RNA polymerase specialized sigma subunit